MWTTIILSLVETATVTDLWVVVGEANPTVVTGELSNVHDLCNLKPEVFSSGLFTVQYATRITFVKEEIPLL